MADGYLTRIGTALAAPSRNMTWTQLAASVVFVLLVIIAWHQIVRSITRN